MQREARRRRFTNLNWMCWFYAVVVVEQSFCPFCETPLNVCGPTWSSVASTLVVAITVAFVKELQVLLKVLPFAHIFHRFVHGGDVENV